MLATIMTSSPELAFLVHIGAANVGVGQSRIEKVALTAGQDDCLRKKPDGRPAGDASRLTHLGDPALERWNRRELWLPIDYDRLG